MKTFTDGQIIKDKLKNEALKSKIKAKASQTERMKKDLKQVKPVNEMKQKQDVGKGISDDYDVDMLKNVNYNQLKEIMED